MRLASVQSMAERVRLAEQKRALLESNPPRNSQSETHRDDVRDAGSGRAESRLARIVVVFRVGTRWFIYRF